jgi:hypothetical protein
MNTLALVMDQQELLMGMYTDPDAIHAALDAITDTLIAYHQRLRTELRNGPSSSDTRDPSAVADPTPDTCPGRIVGSIWPYTILPEELGCSITQDMMPLLGPELYRDFEIPRLKRIADAFGGVQIHCCGAYAQHLPVLRDAGINILGLEFHHPFTPFAALHAIFGNDIVYIPYLFGDCKDYDDYVAFARALLAQGTAETRFWFAQAEGWCDMDALRELETAR